jgi:PhzF family phenazine biosynthesis protein
VEIPIYQIDAFADATFAGNPAAVCPLDAWLDDERLQAIAAENNLSETAFIVARDDGDFDLRWFTPVAEVELCGHATLASGFLILTRLQPDRESVGFHTLSGRLEVARDGGRLAMDFPATPAQPVAAPDGLGLALGREADEVWATDNKYMAVFGDEGAVRGLAPDMAAILALGRNGVIVTALGHECDFVSRFFAPALGIPEDPVTGAAHCVLVPYWAERLGIEELHARQVSARGGELFCRLKGDRVRLSGEAVLYLEGKILVP